MTSRLTPRAPAPPAAPAPTPPKRQPPNPQEETYLEEEGSLLHGLILDEDEVIGLDDAPARLDDPGQSLSGDTERDDDTRDRWHDVGPADDAVDLASALTPDADESGYTREGDAVGFDGEFDGEDLFAGLAGRAAGDDEAALGDELLSDLALPVLPALDIAGNADDAALGPDEDVDALSAAIVRRARKPGSPQSPQGTDEG